MSNDQCLKLPTVGAKGWVARTAAGEPLSHFARICPLGGREFFSWRGLRGVSWEGPKGRKGRKGGWLVGFLRRFFGRKIGAASVLSVFASVLSVFLGVIRAPLSSDAAPRSRRDGTRGRLPSGFYRLLPDIPTYYRLLSGLGKMARRVGGSSPMITETASVWDGNYLSEDYGIQPDRQEAGVSCACKWHIGCSLGGAEVTS
jgi:hypothetical protein